MAQYNVGRVRGSYIHYITSQTDVPLNALLDDMGINTSTWDVYKFDGNAWIYIDNIHGVAAGFDTPSASATTLAAGSQATVSVSSSGPDTAKKFDFTFGIPGSPTVTASVDNSEANLVGQAHVEITNTGTTYAPNFEFAFKQLQGVGVQTIAVTYQQGDSATVVPTGTWSDTPVEADPGKYLWTRYIFNKTDGTNATAYSVARQGSPSDIINVTALEGLGTNWLQYLQQPFLTGNVPIEGNLTVSGDLTAQGDTLLEDTTVNNLVIQGNVTQQGQSFITEAETVEVKDNMITLNNGETGAGVTAGQAGIEIDRGTSNPFFFVFNEDSDRFEVGTSGDLQPVMLRDTEANLTDTNILVWDAANKRAVTSSVNVENLTLNFETKTTGSERGYLITKAEGNTITGRWLKGDDINGFTHPWFREYLSLQVYATIDWDRYYSIFNVDSEETIKFGGKGDRYTVDYAYVSSGTNTADSTEILKVYPTNITFGNEPLAVWGDSNASAYDTYKLYRRNLVVNNLEWTVISTTNATIPKFYAPESAGSNGQILQSDGTSIPKWADKSVTLSQISDLNGGWDTWLSTIPPKAFESINSFTGNRAVITDANGVLVSSPITNTELLALDGISTSQTIQAQLNGKLSLSGGNITGSLTISGNAVATQSWVTNQNYLQSADLSNYVTTSTMNTAISNAIDDLGTLTITGAGSGTYNPNNGNTTINIASYSLPTASSSTLGGIKVGAGLSINSSGVLSATGGGQADSVAWENVTDKPSTFPPSSHTHTASQISDITATAAEINKLDGATVTTSEINLLDGKSSSNFVPDVSTNSQVLISAGGGPMWSSSIPQGSSMITNLQGYAEGSSTSTLTSSMTLNEALASLQNQVQAKLPLAGGTMTGNITSRSIIPYTNNSYNLGSSAAMYNTIYATTFSGTATSANRATTWGPAGSSYNIVVTTALPSSPDSSTIYFITD